MTKLLVIRFSALGDVAMAVPVVRAAALEYPETEITVLSRKQTAGLWCDMPSNVRFFGADLKGRHKGLSGIKQLLNDIDCTRFDIVADLHGVIRSRIITLALKIQGKKTVTIKKGRLSKWMLIHKTGKPAITPTIERYRQVLQQAGYPVELAPVRNTNEKKDIGIAPFAAHRGKIYPLEKMEQVVKRLSRLMSAKGEKIYLFGAGEKEKNILDNWAKTYPSVISVAGQYTMDGEIGLMRSLRLMLTMDSANMHLASLAGTRAISIWGATHPCMGFLGYSQLPEDCIQKNLDCRPCSVYGNKKCRYMDYRCLDIEPEIIVGKIEKSL